MDGALDDLLRHPDLWRARGVVRDAAAGPQSVATGFAALDERLPGGGWPLGALTEILHPAPGIGELSLVLPALAELSRGERWQAWIAPPFHIAVPALEARGVDPSRLLVVRDCAGDAMLWAAEQALGSGACVAVLSWHTRGAGAGRRAVREHTFRHLRRLQLAAERGAALGLVFRGAEAAAQSSPAALRVRLQAWEDTVEVCILKSRGGRRGRVRVTP